MAVLSIDLAHKSDSDIGVCALEPRPSDIAVAPIRLSTLGLKGRPTVDALAKGISSLADQLGASLIIIDGPQGWKSPDNGLLHSRVCERELATQGKTGLPGFTKPSNYAPFIAFAIDFFDHLAELGGPRLTRARPIGSSNRIALESFPTAAWRSLGVRPLPGKARTPASEVRSKLDELRSHFPLSTPDDLTHDELQALVAGLAGVAAESDDAHGYAVSGIAPFVLDGSWREGFIVNPTLEAAGLLRARR